MDEKTKRTVLLLVAIGLVVLAGVQAMQINEISKFCLEISKIRTKKVNHLIMLEKDFTINLVNENRAIIDLIKNCIILKGEEIFIKAIKNARKK